MRKRPARIHETLHYALSESALGFVLLVTSTKGVVFIRIGKDPEEMVGELAQRFPGAQLSDGDKQTVAYVKRVVNYIDAPKRTLDMPLDIRGSDFQKRVWKAVLKIPKGKTATYKDIAWQIGAPAAMRAVGTACSANPIALAIPCHRVTRSDGEVCEGWRSGRRREFLSLELSLR